VAMADEDDVLTANRRFYEAFTRRDIAAVEELWATEAPVACIHPGWDALRGREEVLESWRAILSGGASPAVQCISATAHVLGDAAFVVCGEIIGKTTLVATNVFAREAGAWKMVHHQAGPVSARRPESTSKSRSKRRVLN
jgi:ketosteroid isomerase-like protein